jgi:glycosyltransferase involved in cell wall biosynthesis
MTRSILDLINHPEQMRAMGAAARNFVKEHFAWKDKLLRYEKILEEIAHSPTENGEERKRELEDAPSGT